MTMLRPGQVHDIKEFASRVNAFLPTMERPAVGEVAEALNKYDSLLATVTMLFIGLVALDTLGTAEFLDAAIIAANKEGENIGELKALLEHVLSQLPLNNPVRSTQ